MTSGPFYGALPPMDREFRRRFMLEAYPEQRRLMRGYLLTFILAAASIWLGYGAWDSHLRSESNLSQVLREADGIRHLDEVLTLSARMAALTGEPEWEIRYRGAERMLEQAFDRTRSLSPPLAPVLDRIRAANARLVAQEGKCFELIDSGKPDAASAVLRDAGYDRDKKAYAEHLGQLLAELRRQDARAHRTIRAELAGSLALTLAVLALLGYILYGNHRLLVRRIELEQVLGVVARHLTGADPTRLDADIQHVLLLLATRSCAGQAWLLQSTSGGMPRVTNSWYHATESLPVVDPRAMTQALLACEPDDQGVIAMNPAPETPWTPLGITSVEAVLLPTTKQQFLLALLGAGGSPLRWNHREAAVLQGIGEILARAVENRSLQEQLQRMATTDSLTGLLNRRQFTDSLQREWSRAGSAPLPTALVMLDIDRFKVVNDRHGHAAGDAVLVCLAKLLQANVRDIDHVGRIGGEEFAVILPGTELAGALEVAERLRAEVARARTEHEGLHCTISLGITLVDRADADAQESLGRADRALYAAKDAGRDRSYLCLRGTDPRPVAT
ncbi:MAG: hypothetical protein RLZZ393_1036 [Pseudomonadota bacterium]